MSFEHDANLMIPWNVRTGHFTREKHELGNGTGSLQGLYNLDHVQRNRFLQVFDKQLTLLQCGPYLMSRLLVKKGNLKFV